MEFSKHKHNKVDVGKAFLKLPYTVKYVLGGRMRDNNQTIRDYKIFTLISAARNIINELNNDITETEQKEWEKWIRYYKRYEEN